MNKRLLSLALVFVLIVSVFAGCKKDENYDGLYYVDDEGVTQYVQADDDGKYYVTDNDGNKTYIEDDNINQQIQENVEEAKREEILNEIGTDTDKFFEDSDEDDGLEISDELVTEEMVTVPAETGEKKAFERLEVYRKVIDTNNFTIDATVKEIGGDNMEYPFLYIRSGNNAYVATAIPFDDSGKVIKANMIILDGKTYCEIPSMKSYMEMDDMTIEDLADDTFNSATMEAYEFVESGTVTINGKKYTCDVFEIGTETVKYYYDSSNNIVRIESIQKRSSTITEFKSITNTADTSKIKKPKGINLTSILGDVI